MCRLVVISLFTLHSLSLRGSCISASTPASLQSSFRLIISPGACGPAPAARSFVGSASGSFPIFTGRPPLTGFAPLPLRIASVSFVISRSAVAHPLPAVAPISLSLAPATTPGGGPAPLVVFFVGRFAPAARPAHVLASAGTPVLMSADTPVVLLPAGAPLSIVLLADAPLPAMASAHTPAVAASSAVTPSPVPPVTPATRPPVAPAA